MNAKTDHALSTARQAAVQTAGNREPATRGTRGQEGLARRLRWPAIAGVATVLAFFGVFGGWATTAPLAGAAISQGTVSPDSQRKSVQHLEGGIVREIHVREGSRVAEGDLLVTLLDTKASSTFEQDLVQKRALSARRTRLEREYRILLKEEATIDTDEVTGAPAAVEAKDSLAFPKELEEAAGESRNVAEILESERQNFRARLAAYDVNLRLLQQTIAKSRAEIVELERQKQAIVGQSKLMEQEIAIVSGLLDKKLESGSRLLSLQRERLRMDEDLAALDVRISSNRQSMASTELEIENLGTSRLQELSDELVSTRSELQTIEERMRANLDTLKRTAVRSPVDGTVVNLQVHTAGGVVTPGQVMMDIVPQNDQLIIDARIIPNDIDSVHPGQSVKVVLLAYPQRQMPVIHGKLISVSADAIVDQQDESYYLGKVEVDPDALKRLGSDIALVPGMEVELFITTVERTFFDYLLDPLFRSARRSFVES